jgi:hypothetical protein
VLISNHSRIILGKFYRYFQLFISNQHMAKLQLRVRQSDTTTPPNKLRGQVPTNKFNKLNFQNILVFNTMTNRK